MVIENVLPRYKSLTTAVIFIIYAVSHTLLAMQAWLISDWRMLQILTSAPYIVFLISLQVRTLCYSNYINCSE